MAWQKYWVDSTLRSSGDQTRSLLGRACRGAFVVFLAPIVHDEALHRGPVYKITRPILQNIVLISDPWILAQFKILLHTP